MQSRPRENRWREIIIIPYYSMERIKNDTVWLLVKASNVDEHLVRPISKEERGTIFLNNIRSGKADVDSKKKL